MVYVNLAFQRGMETAWEAVKAAAARRAEDPAYTNLVGRPLTTKDFYTTLLVATHTTIRVKDADRSLVFGCAVGDGMIAAMIDRGSASRNPATANSGQPSGGVRSIGQALESRLLMKPDSGEHSGEVQFLEEKEIEPERLRQRVFSVLGPLRALLLMTDGVADDYFPNDARMMWLYGDLVLNGIVASDRSAESEMKKASRRYTLAHPCPRWQMPRSKRS